jgi:hypothetical protein
MKKNLLILLILPLVLASCSSGPLLPTEEEAKAAIMEKINFANDRWSNGDPTGFVDVVAPDATYMDDIQAFYPIAGKEAFAKYAEALKGNIPVHEKELTDFMFQFYDDIVIITYRYNGIIDGVPANPWKVTSVYRYNEGNWLSVHENWSMVKMPEKEEDPVSE